ncbi:unnamed protein product [Didymodactylos carnosus]|uniref:B30.2/SPRY domain-containing protein n=1 Tax=Didymodactylos carnosus TaxID=1234261 RepID=A0A8S2CKZ6_9BILA|nr:unnamed protein product [Didymodactylos carnosus]CAF3508293.1 unnamed protein product [Didymodactylos carnosus]
MWSKQNSNNHYPSSNYHNNRGYNNYGNYRPQQSHHSYQQQYAHVLPPQHLSVTPSQYQQHSTHNYNEISAPLPYPVKKEEPHHYRNNNDNNYRHQRQSFSAPIKTEPDDWNQDTKETVLDVYNSDLNLLVQNGLLRGEPLTEGGFCTMWAGVRATYGMNKYKIAYQVKVLKHMDCPDLPKDESFPFVARVGWSVDESKLFLGEEPLSYGYGGTGKKSTANRFENYGESYTVGDTITCYADFESECDSVLLSYSKNDRDCGVAYRIDYNELQSKPLFPHILTKNVAFEANFGQIKTEYRLKHGYRFINEFEVGDRMRGTVGPSTKEECEVIMMVGLPACGKTVWAEKHLEMNAEKKYYILGTNNIINQMKISGLYRRDNYHNRWDALIDRSTKCLNKLFQIAINRKRNYIIDQTNVYASARRRKMLTFENFYRRAVVVIPSDEEYQKRKKLQEEREGKEVPEKAIHEMKANFDLPEIGEIFDDVEYTDLSFHDAQQLVTDYKRQGEMFRPPPERKRKGDERFQQFEQQKQMSSFHNSSSSYHDSKRQRTNYSNNNNNYNNNYDNWNYQHQNQNQHYHHSHSYHGGY